ncbi:MAG TPA: polymer-forming cytoskeletal protein [Tepidisphaeraceae bacterium]|jgi:cytoskeletal protein CcmA (bactofilin family)
MADSSPTDYPTIIGPDASFKGEMTFDKGMRIHGRFEGKITTPGRIHIAKEAKLQADLDAGSLLVEGEVHGNLTAGERIELKNSARYEGDMRANKLIVEEGAIFNGHVSVGPEAVKAGSKPQSSGSSSRPSVSVTTSVPQQQPARVG